MIAMMVSAARICRRVASQSFTSVSSRERWVGFLVIIGMKVMKEMNAQARRVIGTSKAVMIVAYFAVPADTTPTRNLKIYGRSFAKIFDVQSANQTTSTHMNIH